MLSPHDALRTYLADPTADSPLAAYAAYRRRARAFLLATRRRQASRLRRRSC